MFKPFFTWAAIAATAVIAGCMSVPEGLDLSLSKPTREHRYVVDLHPLGDRDRINQMQAWEARVTTADGKPVSGARIEVGGGMPQHGHGLPTRPAVTRALDDGRYVIGGVKFSMSGWWELKLKIDSANGGQDDATFNVVVGQKVPSQKTTAASAGKA
jgi:hypothetical protein